MTPKQKPLKPKQERFAREYAIDQNASRAAIEAGYAANSARITGCRLLTKDNIKAFIDKLLEEQSKRTDITADKVLTEISKLAFGNVQDFYTKAGKLKAIQNLTPEQAACISEIKETASGRLTYKIADKGINLERLGKHLKLFTDKVELSGNLNNLSEKELDDKIKSLTGITDE